MQRLTRDDGAVAVFVAIFAVVLFGFGALVVDVSALYHERRILQRGADAASLAVAQACAAGPCGDPWDRSRTYANGNADDGESHVEEVCGAGADALAPCTPALTVPGSGYVAVRTATGDDGSTDVVAPLLARVLDDEYQGTTVRARAVANWGPPASMRSILPFVFGNCEWEHYTNSGMTYPGTITPPTWPTRPDGSSLEATIFLAGGGTPCPGTPPGGDSSGGFGWLGGDGDRCTEVSEADGFIGNRTGEGTAGCNYAAVVGTTVHVPVFDCQTDLSVPDPDYDEAGKCYGQGPESGAAVRYHIVGYVTLYVTGISMPGVRVPSQVTGTLPCSGVQKCISGFFTTGLAPQSAPVGDGPDFGSTVVGLTYVSD